MSNIPLDAPHVSEKDCFSIIDRRKSAFTYHLHRHDVCEIQFVQHAAGAKRVFGDSIETIGEYDLVLCSSGEMEHVWLQGDCTSPEFRQITIQFSIKDLDSFIRTKNQLHSIAEMMDKARYGMAFDMDTILKVYDKLDSLASIPDGFAQLVCIMKIVYDLSFSKGRVLATRYTADLPQEQESDRIVRVRKYISEHFREDLSLDCIANIAGMSPSAFSRFFKQAMSKSLTAYITETRVQIAGRMLVNTKGKISEICERCGFNNLSNFNRVFKDSTGLTPREYRTQYKKKSIVQ